MAEEEDDYLSDKFLLEATSASSASSSSRTYSQRRKEAERQARIRNEQNRIKSRRERELESRQEGLSKSLFERAKEEEAAGGKGNKGLSLMMKMGFKPGQALGRSETEEHQSEPQPADVPSTLDASRTEKTPEADKEAALKPKISHRTQPLPLNEWEGKIGIGLRKRGLSPDASERLAKMAKLSEQTDHTFRNRAREQYEEKRAEGRLGPSQMTCRTLDEKDGKDFNILWLSPNNPDAFPDALLDALAEEPMVASVLRRRNDESVEARLRLQMKADALQPLADETEDDSKPITPSVSKEEDEWPPEVIEEALQFLRLSAPLRLQMVLGYLREKYSYCFWCGTQYDNADELNEQCPGEDEDAHD